MNVAKTDDGIDTALAIVNLTSAMGKQVLSLTDLAEIETYPLKFRFRYFQDLSGPMAMPLGFQPEKVVVTVVQQGRRGNDLQQTFEWSVRQD